MKNFKEGVQTIQEAKRWEGCAVEGFYFGSYMMRKSYNEYQLTRIPETEIQGVARPFPKDAQTFLGEHRTIPNEMRMFRMEDKGGMTLSYTPASRLDYGKERKRLYKYFQYISNGETLTFRVERLNARPQILPFYVLGEQWEMIESVGPQDEEWLMMLLLRTPTNAIRRGAVATWSRHRFHRTVLSAIEARNLREEMTHLLYYGRDGRSRFLMGEKVSLIRTNGTQERQVEEQQKEIWLLKQRLRVDSVESRWFSDKATVIQVLDWMEAEIDRRGETLSYTVDYGEKHLLIEQDLM